MVIVTLLTLECFIFSALLFSLLVNIKHLRELFYRRPSYKIIINHGAFLAFTSTVTVQLQNFKKGNVVKHFVCSVDMVQGSCQPPDALPAPTEASPRPARQYQVTPPCTSIGLDQVVPRPTLTGQMLSPRHWELPFGVQLTSFRKE